MSTDTIIVGGSLSGLFCALTLMKLGRCVHILERRTSDQLQDQGGGLKLGQDVVDFLCSLGKGIKDESAYIVRNTKLVVFDEAGHEIDTRDINVPSTSWGCLYETLRDSFDREASKTKSTYTEGVFVKDVRESDEGSIVVEYEYNGALRTSSAGLLIGADGASSRVRQIFVPGIERTYAGYVGWRGVVPYSELDGIAPDSLVYNRTWHFGKDYKVIAYSVPAQASYVSRDSQLNYVWYHNMPEERLRDLLTDVDGIQHAYTVSSGKMRPSVVQELHEHARQLLPDGLRNVVQHTREPFLQVITDSLVPQNVFMNGKILIVGDAAAVVRPHVGTGTGQAIFHGNLLGDLIKGAITVEKWSEVTMKYSTLIYQAGRELGDICQHTPLDTAVQKAESFRNRLAALFRDLDGLQKSLRLAKSD